MKKTIYLLLGICQNKDLTNMKKNVFNNNSSYSNALNIFPLIFALPPDFSPNNSLHDLQ